MGIILLVFDHKLLDSKIIVSEIHPLGIMNVCN